jgi:starch synthase
MPSVLIIGSEALPFSKTGGLGDVLGALPPALARLGWDVTLVLPKYRGITAGDPIGRLTLMVGRDRFDAGIVEAPMKDGARALLVDVPALYDRDAIYHVDNVDYADNPLRFALLVRAAFEWFASIGRRPDIVHAHDWQAGLAPVYLKGLYRTHPTLGGTPSVFTIHNLAYQGNFNPSWLSRLDLPTSLMSTDRLEYWGNISFMKGGINDADMITTVSPRYAEEIQTPAFGFGFEGILRARRDRLVGILNGIDTTEWDPARDTFLPEPFSAAGLAGKRAAKAAVLARFGLPKSGAALNVPLIGMISRMVDQKGFDLIAAVERELPRLDARFVILGTGESRYEALCRSLADRYPKRIGVRVGFEEGLAHLIEGGADMFLMPSSFEPCGLNQMYSLRYGTVPIVRAVGGLADTVQDELTGYVIPEHTPAALLDGIGRALGAFKKPRKWRAMQAAGMKRDHSWDRSAREYVKIYGRLLGAGG